MSKIIPAEKRCPRCTEVKPSSEFNKNAPAYDGLQSYCRACSVASNRDRANDVHRRRVAGELPTFTVESKTCSKCGETKPAAEMSVRRGSPDGLSAWCRYCHRDKEMHRKYGISAAVYDAMKAAQGGKCAICQQKARLVLDHCHSVGTVRGLLCHGCNTGLGFFADEIERLKNAITYLEGSRP